MAPDAPAALRNQSGADIKVNNCGVDRALIVEDDRKDAELVEVTLNQLSVSTIVRAENGESGWANFSNSETGVPFELVVCDLRMPGMSKLDLLHAVLVATLPTDRSNPKIVHP